MVTKTWELENEFVTVRHVTDDENSVIHIVNYSRLPGKSLNDTIFRSDKEERLKLMCDFINLLQVFGEETSYADVMAVFSISHKEAKNTTSTKQIDKKLNQTGND